MTTYVPPKYGSPFICYVALVSRSTGQFQTNPTLAAGDFKISKDGGALANLATLPAVTPAASKSVKIALDSDEMTAENIVIIGSDAAGAEWDDIFLNIQTSVKQIDDLQSTIWSSPTATVNLSGTTVKAVTDGVTVGTNNDKTGYSLTATTGLGNQTANITGNLSGSVGSVTNRVTANTDQWAGGTIPAPNVTGVPKVDLTDIDGAATNGNNATLNLKQLNIINNNGIAFVAQATGGDGYGAYFAGNGFGPGIGVDGGATSKGIAVTSVYGAALDLTNLSGGDGMDITASQYGINISSLGNSAIGLYGNFSIEAPNNIQVSDGNLTLGAITDAVWDEATAGHTTAGTTGKALTDAGSAGDPWSTALPGAYGAGTAGDIIGNSVPGIKTQTDKLTFDSDNYVESHPMTGVTVTTNNDKTGYALTSAYDPAKTASQDSDMQTALTNLSTIEAKTDQLTFTNPGEVDANVQAINDTEVTGDGSATPWGPA